MREFVANACRFVAAAATGRRNLGPAGLWRRLAAALFSGLAMLPAQAEQYWYHEVDSVQQAYSTPQAACVAGGQLYLAQQQLLNPTLKHRIQIITTQVIEPDFEYLCKVTIQRKQLGVWIAALTEQPYSAFASGTACPLPGLGDGNGYCGPKRDPGGCSGSGGGAGGGGGGGGGDGSGGGSSNGSNPIDGSSGNKFQSQTDYRGAGWMPLTWTRAYNHLSFERGALGINWKHGYERRIAVTAFTTGGNQITPTAVKLYRHDGRRYNLNASGASWVGAEPDIDYRLERVVDSEAGTTGWRLRTPDNQLETYDAQGLLTAISRANGGTLTLAYDSGNNYRLAGVTDDFGRALTLGYDAQGRINAVTLPNGRAITYSYSATNNLATAVYPEGAGSVTRSYLYNEPAHVGASFPNALTGIVDEAGKRFATFKYDAQQRAFQSTHAGGANSNTFTYNADASATVVDALGTSRNFGYTNILGRSVVTGVSQPCAACGGTVAQNLTYDANGNATSATDFNANKRCNAFDTARNLQTAMVEGLPSATTCSAVTPDGAALPAGARKRQTQWHPDWRIPTRRSEPKKITTWVYNGQPDPFNGNALASCAPAQGVLANGLPIAVVCKRVEQSTTDASGAAGFAATIGNGVAGNTTPAIRTWTYSYNRYGQVLTTDGARTDVSDVTTYAYHASTTADARIGDLQSLTNALGHVTQFTQYDAHGQWLSMTDANGIATTLTYDERQRLKTRTVAGRSTAYTYDPRGLLQQVSFPAGTASNAAGVGGASVDRSTTYAYDDAQRLVSITSASGEQMLYTLDGLGNITREEILNSTAVSGSASLLRREFDALGRVFREIRIINGTDQTTERTYDAQGNLRTVQRPLEASYGESSAPVETRVYNALNQLARIEDAQYLAAQPTILTPDARDQLASVQAANNATTTYQRDGFDQVLLETSPDRGSTAYTYDAAGNLKTQLGARGVTTAHTWDALNRLTTTVYTQSGQTSTEDRAYTWDANSGGPIACANGVGRLCRVVDAAGTTHHAFDAFGNLTEARTIELGIDRSLRFGHDGENRPSSLISAGSKALASVRDVEGRVTQVLGLVNGVASQIVKTATYRGDGQADATTLGNDVALDRSFDSSGAASGFAETGIQPGGGTSSSDDIPTAPEWALLLLGAILLWQGARAKQVGRTLHSAWPVAALILLAAASNAQANESLLFDARGNVKGRTVDGTASTYRYDRIDRLNQETGVANQTIGLDPNANRTGDGAATYTVLANGNRLTTRNGVALTYDAEGNLLSDQTVLNGSTVSRTFTYTLAGQLKTVSINGVLKATYTYNHLNQRTRKLLASPAAGTPATTLYRYDTQGHLVEEIAGSAASAPGISITAGQSLATYVWKDDTPSAVIYAPNSPGNAGNASERILYLHTDHLDTPRKATDSLARVVWNWNSDAFGSTAANEDVDGDGSKTVVNLRFPGQYLDAESGLHYNWHRYYDAQVGRFSQFDPAGLDAGMNAFNYADGNPIRLTDPTGLASEPNPFDFSRLCKPLGIPEDPKKDCKSEEECWKKAKSGVQGCNTKYWLPWNTGKKLVCLQCWQYYAAQCPGLSWCED